MSSKVLVFSCCLAVKKSQLACLFLYRSFKLSESERKNLFDPKPLKYYRPPLKTDSRTLIEKITELSIEQQPASNSANISVSSKNLSRSTEKSSLPNTQSTSTKQPFLRKYSFSVRDFDVSTVIKNQAAVTIVVAEDGRQSIKHDHSRNSNKVGCVSTQTPVRDSLKEAREKQSQSWRLGLYSIQSQDSQSCVKTPSRNPPQMSSTPISSFKRAEDCDMIQPNSLITKNVDLHNKLNKPMLDCSADIKHGHRTSNSSFDESSLSSVDGIVPLVPEELESDPATSSVNSLRHYSCNMDQTTESSSGFSSLNCSMQNNSSQSSPVRKGASINTSMSQKLPQTSRKNLRKELDDTLNSHENSFDSTLSQKSDSLSSLSVRSCTSPMPQDESLTSLPRTEPKVYPNSLMKSMRKNSESSSDCMNPGKVIHSWKASFSATEVQNPKSSELNFKQNSIKEFKSKWDHDSSNSSMASMGLPTSFGTRNTMKRRSVDTSTSQKDLSWILRECFSKRFTFESSDWGLPDPDTLFTSEPWEIQQFLRQKKRLNAVKDELNDLPLQDWHKHTRRRNVAGNIIWQLRNKIDPEFPTQAWCKFYENVSCFPLVPKKAIDNKRLNSIHLCEAPGAFITSLNHFLHVNHGDDFKFDWRAVTLNPYYEGNPLSCMINDDRLILKTLDKWLFGEDYTGDLMQKKNLTSIVEGASELGEILLVTADGSIDCQDDPAEQEEIVSWLHYCETVAALQILAPGGSFLIKMFTFYEHFSIGLMYLLNCVFRKVIVNKPVTSKEGNSEVYVVCLDYSGAHTIKPWLDVLLKNYGSKAPLNTLFPMDILPVSFVDQLYKCADFFRKLQSNVIEENLRSFHHPAKQDNYLVAKVRNRVAEEFFVRYN